MRRHGLTSIELFIASALLGILATLALPVSSRAEAGEDSVKTNELVLHTRTFQVDPNKFFAGLNGAPGFTNKIDSSDPSDVQRAVAKFFADVGVDLKAPKSVFFHDRRGTLTVRATDEDLELIEQAIITLNFVPPEVSLKVRFVEVSDEDIFKPGFEWYLKRVASGRNDSLVGIMTEPEFKAVLNGLETRKDAVLLQEATITTLSGRQAQIQLDTKILANESHIYNDTNYYGTNNPFTLDVVAYVEKDGYTVQLSLIPTVTQVIEYPPPGNFLATGTNSSIPIASPLPLPHMRVRQTVTSCILWDGQTAVLLLGPYVQHKQNLAVFVTATIIDSSGNRKHTKEELLSREKGVPPQTQR